jgi:hypothetical protein
MIGDQLSSMVDAYSASRSQLCRILDVSLNTNIRQRVDISKVATPQRFRFIDCKAFRDERALRVFESSELNFSYAAISYVWKGNPLNQTFRDAPSLVVAGAEDGDPINLDVLRIACVAAIKSNANYLWLDRICIMQLSQEDNSWQIRRMAHVYKKCGTCFILPGGLGRLVRLDEETAWINRSWTLQEALVPAATKCLFHWRKKSGKWAGVTTGIIECVEDNCAAMTSLPDLVQASLATYLTFNGEHIAVKIFGATRAPVMALNGAMNLRERDGREVAIWRCALMRASKRELDVVFSIMGLFGVTLDPSKYQGGDRNQAIVDLTKSIMENGGKANWIGASLQLPVPSRLCTLPTLPEANIQGSAFIRTAEGRSVESSTNARPRLVFEGYTEREHRFEWFPSIYRTDLADLRCERQAFPITVRD